VTPFSIFETFDQDSANWVPWRSFFFSLKGDVKLDFKNNERVNGILTGKIDTLNIRENHIKVYRGDVEVPSEELGYIQSFNDFAKTLQQVDLSSAFESIPVLGGIPIQPYPSIAKCLGLQPRAAMVEIQDRFMRVGYDFRVFPADTKCLFDVFEDKESKFARWEKESGELIPQLAQKARDILADGHKKFNELLQGDILADTHKKITNKIINAQFK
jgi:hypothetical protein